MQTNNRQNNKTMNTEATPEETTIDYASLKAVVFLDQLGRPTVGALAPTQPNDDTLDVYAPAIITFGQGQNPGEIGIQLLPILFPDVSSDPDKRALFRFKKSRITETDFDLDPNLLNNYLNSLKPRSNLFVPQTAGQVIPASAPQPPVKKLFA